MILQLSTCNYEIKNKRTTSCCQASHSAAAVILLPYTLAHADSSEHCQKIQRVSLKEILKLVYLLFGTSSKRTAMYERNINIQITG